MFWSILLSILAGAIGLAYYYSTSNFGYWKKKNIPYAKPSPLFGNYGNIFRVKKHIVHTADDICKEFPDEPLIGAFMGTTPTLIVKDPEYIKMVTTKDFYYFNSRGLTDFSDHEVFNKNLFSSHGDYWKTVRQNLSPIFSTAKMRNMFPLIADCAYAFEKLVDEETSISNVMPAQKLMARFTMACITSAAFGVDSQTMDKGYKTNPFTKAGEMVFRKSKIGVLRSYIRLTWPSVFYFFGQTAVPKQITDMFHDFMTSVFQARNYKPTKRNDFVDFVLGFKEKEFITGETLSHPNVGEVKKTSVEVSDEFLVSNCLVFFLAGFETSATTLSYTLYELAKSPDSQKRLLKEIDDYLARTGNKLEYESISELPYMQACIDETLRLYPVLGVGQREVVEEVTLGSVRLDKGVQIHIPTYSIHHDPKYFPEPEVYRPERFLGEQKQNIVPHSYMPFGDGPRLCIGMRFARMQMTAGLVTLLKKYSLELAPGTPTEAEWDPQTVLLPSPKETLNLKFNVRDGWENRVFVKPENRTSCKA